MRRRTMLALVAGGTLVAVAGGAFARNRARSRAPIPQPVTGIFPNGMAYLRWGTGPKSLLWVPGGPGNSLPGGMFLSNVLLRAARPLVEAGYTLWVVARKRNMPQGHSTADMAEDYAGMIADELGGKVDLVVGVSFGGAIGFHLAARHPDRFGHVAIVGAAYDANDEGKALDHEFARLRSEGRDGEASALMLRQMSPASPVPGVARVLGEVMARLMFGPTHPTFPSDVMVEAEAEMALGAREVLPDISVPVLLVCGDADMYIPRELYEETARLIPDCTLRMYEGVGHVGTIRDPRFPRDVLDFVGETHEPEASTGGGHTKGVLRIEAPVEHVWAFLCDTSRWHDWDSRSAYSDFSGPVDQAGTTFVETSRIMGRGITAHHTVVEVEPERLLRHRSDKGFDVSFLLEPDGAATRLTIDVAYQLPGPLPGFAADFLGRGFVEPTGRRAAAAFKALAEATAPVPA
jgi:pimeloyl-ACP methyl ester carboxylesterase